MKKHTKIIALALVSFLVNENLNAQNIAINTTGTAANTSSMLDISSGAGSNKGLLIPRVTSAQKTAMNPLPAAAQGLVVYQTDGVQGFYYNTSTTTTPTWNYVNPATGWTILGNAGTSAATNFIGTTDAVDWVVRTTNTERMRVLAGGNVGIGIAAPTQKLDVQGGNARINNAFIGDVGHGAGWGGIAHSSQATTTGYALISSNDGNYTLINKENTGAGHIGFRVGNADLAVITNAGNMGIGTASPAYRLDLANGTFGFGSSNQRTETRDDAGLQGSAGAQSGFFETSAPSTNYPAGAASWWHLIDVRHSNTGNNYAMQFSGSFFDQRLWFRKTAGAANTAWCEVLTSTATIGQTATSYFSTAGITLAAGSALTYITGYPVNITVPANYSVLLSGDVGVQTTSGLANGYSVVDVVLIVDGVVLTDGGYQRLTVSNNGGLGGHMMYASFSQAFASLSAGVHTIGIAALNQPGSANAVIGGNNTSVLQAELTATMIKE